MNNNKVKPVYNSKIYWGSRMETVGDTLKKERIRLKKDIPSISLDTKIDEKKLKALEENDFTLFESPVSTKGFIKIYSDYLGLNSEKILAIYRRDFGEKKEEKNKKKELEKEEKTPWKHVFLLIPAIILFLVLAYLYNQFNQFQNPPDLEILEPKNNITVNKEALTIKGQTETDAIVEIENTKIPIDDEGFFTTKIILQEGKNIVVVKSASTRNPTQESVETLNINYEIEEVEQTQESEDIEKIVLKVVVENNPTWVEIIVDDQMIVSRILPVGYEKEFEAERNAAVNTGILTNTKVEINGERRNLSQENFSISCEIVDTLLECTD